MERNRRPWDVSRPISGVAFLCAGFLLMAVKFGVDWSIAHVGFGRPWPFTSYFSWPGGETVRTAALAARLRGADQIFGLTLLFASLPFVTAGILLTARRLRTIGLPGGLVVAFFLPWVNLLFFTILVIAPTRFEDPEAERLAARALGRPPVTGSMRAARRKAALLAIVVSATSTLVLIWLGVNVFENYGLGIFVGAPFLLGLLSSTLAGGKQPCAFAEGLMIAGWAMLAVAAVLVFVAIEGIGCIVMALPIAATLAFLGALIGYAIQKRAWSSRRIQALCAGLLALSPALMAMEAANPPPLELREVVTSVVVDAPPQDVWRLVVAFPPIPERRESWLESMRDGDAWLFRAGIAEPRSAEIQGSGVGPDGMVRHCIFSTGTFVEPIVVWDPPRLLRFDVTDQPPTMREWSPYDIHPPHLDGFLVSRQGQFKLTPLADGRTLLEGTTWYTNAMWPAPYWALWSDAMIHAIHRRVLRHIAALAE